jgi:ATP-dependent Clp protease ATP-binding subunit ClpX
MKPRNAYCSFCRKGYRDVGPLVEGPGDVYICGECIELCQAIIEQEKRRRNVQPAGPAAPDPIAVRATLDRLVAGQECAKAVLVEAASCRHEGSGRVLLTGPSQCSAMFLAKVLAYALDVPFGAGDSRDLAKSEKGNPLLNLLEASDYDMEAAQRGVVFVAGTERLDAQDALLTLWQQGVGSPVPGLEFDVRGILFVCGGTFVGLDEAIVRLGRHPEQPVPVEALRATGARPEWAGALTAIARVPPLDEETLTRIVDWVEFRKV